MAQSTKLQLREDPSDIAQYFPKYEINILCCRYWWIKNWEFQDLSFPFWRIYHNDFEGASISYKGENIPLKPDTAILIPPYTSYSTRLYDNKLPTVGYSLVGGRVHENLKEENTYNNHMFLHFTISHPYNYSHEGVYSIPIDGELKKKLSKIKEYLTHNASQFDFTSTIIINSIISQLLYSLPNTQWNSPCNDQRMLQLIRYIDKNLDCPLDNTILAQRANLSTNSFIRLFTKETGVAPQQYVKSKRIEKACILFHHSNISIEEIATRCGFMNRYHFSRIFKQVKGISPAKYRRNLHAT